MADKEEKDEIKVEDRRHFDRQGNPVKGEEAPQQPKSSTRSSVSKDAQISDAETHQPKIDFITVLFSFVHTALIHLGDMPDPATNAASQDLNAAQEMIDILEMLQEKTKGNLNQQEQQYLQSALFDLRLRFVEKNKLIK